MKSLTCLDLINTIKGTRPSPVPAMLGICLMTLSPAMLSKNTESAAGTYTHPQHSIPPALAAPSNTNTLNAETSVKAFDRWLNPDMSIFEIAGPSRDNTVKRQKKHKPTEDNQSG